MPELPPQRPPRLVTVAIAARDEQELIGEQLEALAGQTYGGDWEVLVVDDGSRDATREAALSHRRTLPGLRVHGTGRRGLNHARNVAASLAGGDLVAFCDADDVVEPGWLAALAEAAPRGHIVGGPLEHLTLNDLPHLTSWRPTRLQAELPTEGFFLVHAPGGNCAVWTEAARELRWDETFRFAGSDLEFCWRAQLRGYTLAFAPGAVVQRRLRPDPLGVAVQHFHYGAAMPRLYTLYREQGMPGPDRRRVRNAWSWLVRHAPRAASSPEMRGAWLRKAAFRAGLLAGSARHGVLYP